MRRLLSRLTWPNRLMLSTATLLLGWLLVELATYRLLPWLAPAYQTERFELTASPATAEGYPMKTMEGHFLTSFGKDLPLASEFLHSEWGRFDVFSDRALVPAPADLQARWFSYTEDKFYEGRWALPQQRIHALLRQGYWDARRQEHGTYDRLIVCFLPKGVVVVWLSGENQVLLGRYQAQEIAFDFKKFDRRVSRPDLIAESQAELPAAVQAQIRTGTLSTKQWDTYLKKYPWKLEFSQPLQLRELSSYYLNGEATRYPVAPESTEHIQNIMRTTPKPVPTNLHMSVAAGDGRQRQIQVRAFDEDQTLAAFQTLHAAHPTLPLTLFVDTDARVDSARLFLQNARQRIALDKSPVLLFDAE